MGVAASYTCTCGRILVVPYWRFSNKYKQASSSERENVPVEFISPSRTLHLSCALMYFGRPCWKCISVVVVVVVRLRELVFMVCSTSWAPGTWGVTLTPNLYWLVEIAQVETLYLRSRQPSSVMCIWYSCDGQCNVPQAGAHNTNEWGDHHLRVLFVVLLHCMTEYILVWVETNYGRARILIYNKTMAQSPTQASSKQLHTCTDLLNGRWLLLLCCLQSNHCAATPPRMSARLIWDYRFFRPSAIFNLSWFRQKFCPTQIRNERFESATVSPVHVGLVFSELI